VFLAQIGGLSVFVKTGMGSDYDEKSRGKSSALEISMWLSEQFQTSKVDYQGDTAHSLHKSARKKMVNRHTDRGRF